MARIIYGVAGQGIGHASRSKILIEHLLSQGHQVRVVSHDKGYENLSPFFEVLKITGLHITYKENQAKYLETLFSNIKKLPKLQKTFKQVSDLVTNFKPQIVISDFEPITSLVSNLEGVPLISIDNLHQMTHTKISYPREFFQEALTAKTITRLMVHSAKAYLVTSFFKTTVTHANTYLMPPILRKEVLEIQPTTGDFILVYTTSNFSKVIDILKKINAHFIIYGVGDRPNEDNLVFKSPSQAGFLKDLAECQAVFATAGLSLISEALHLGKPYLAMPVEGQFEQILNAYYLEKLGYGQFLQKVTKENVETFLLNLGKYRLNLLKYKKEDNQKIFNKLDNLIKQYSLKN